MHNTECPKCGNEVVDHGSCHVKASMGVPNEYGVPSRVMTHYHRACTGDEIGPYFACTK